MKLIGIQSTCVKTFLGKRKTCTPLLFLKRAIAKKRNFPAKTKIQNTFRAGIIPHFPRQLSPQHLPRRKTLLKPAQNLPVAPSAQKKYPISAPIISAAPSAQKKYPISAPIISAAPSAQKKYPIPAPIISAAPSARKKYPISAPIISAAPSALKNTP